MVETGHGSAAKLRVLIVEEQSGDRLVPWLLENSPTTETSSVTTVAESRSAVEAGLIEVLVLDRPGTIAAADDDLTALVDLAGDRAAIVVVADDPESELAALYLGAQDYLVRDHVTRSTLLRTLMKAVSRHRSVAGARAAAERRSEQAIEAAARDAAARAVVLPDALVADVAIGEPGEALVDALCRLLDEGPIEGITLARLSEAGDTPIKLLQRGSDPVGPILRAAMKQDMAAQLDDAMASFGRYNDDTDDLGTSLERTVRIYAELWGRAPQSLRLAATWGATHDAVRDLRWEHLKALAAVGADHLSRHASVVTHENPQRAIDLSVDQLLALLDQQLLFGPLHPSEGSPNEVVAEVAGRMACQLMGAAERAIEPATRKRTVRRVVRKKTNRPPKEAEPVVDLREIDRGAIDPTRGDPIVAAAAATESSRANTDSIFSIPVPSPATEDGPSFDRRLTIVGPIPRPAAAMGRGIAG